MLKAILFDLDDTLIDWSSFAGSWESNEAKHLRRVHDYLCSQGSLPGLFEEFNAEYVRRTRDAWAYARSSLLAPHLGKILLETARFFGVEESLLDMQRCLEVYDWHAVEGTDVFPDVIDGLRTLQGHNLKFGIVTNAYQPMAMRDVEIDQHGLLSFFPGCRYSAADVGYLKPHPVIFETALHCLGTAPEETLFVGDNPVADIAGAQGAGMRAVLRVKQPSQTLLSGLVVPDGAINSLEELPELLDELYPGWR